MSTSQHPHLHAIIGDTEASLPPPVAAELEAALAARASLSAQLRAMHPLECSDGQPWNEHRLGAGRMLALAQASRSLGGLNALLRLLHATERVRVAGVADEPLDEAVRDGVLLACRELAERAQDGLRLEGGPLPNAA